MAWPAPWDDGWVATAIVLEEPAFVHPRCPVTPFPPTASPTCNSLGQSGPVTKSRKVQDLETDRLYGRLSRRKTWVQWLSFLKWVRRRYPAGQTLHIVLDN